MSSTGKNALALSSSVLVTFANAVNLMAQGLPPRVSMAQLAFFLLAASRDIAGHPTTFSELKEELGERGDSIKSTYAIFLAPGRTFPDGLGWLEGVPDPNDRRNKFLRLTPEGERIMRAVLEVLKG